MITSDCSAHIFFPSLILSLSHLFFFPGGSILVVDVSKLITLAPLHIFLWKQSQKMKVLITLYISFEDCKWTAGSSVLFCVGNVGKEGSGKEKRGEKRRTGQRKGDVLLNSHDLQQ